MWLLSFPVYQSALFLQNTLIKITIKSHSILGKLFFRVAFETKGSRSMTGKSFSIRLFYEIIKYLIEIIAFDIVVAIICSFFSAAIRIFLCPEVKKANVCGKSVLQIPSVERLTHLLFFVTKHCKYPKSSEVWSHF